MRSFRETLDRTRVLVIDETQVFQCALSHTDASLTTYTFTDMFMGLSDAVTGDIRNGKYNLVLVMVPPRRYIGQKRYQACLQRLVGLHRTACLCGVCSILMGREGLMKEILQLDKQTYYSYHSSCRYTAVEPPHPAKHPIHGRWCVCTSWPMQHQGCNCVPGTMHYDVYSQHSGPFRLQLQRNVEWPIVTQILNTCLQACPQKGKLACQHIPGVDHPLDLAGSSGLGVISPLHSTVGLRSSATVEDTARSLLVHRSDDQQAWGGGPSSSHLGKPYPLRDEGVSKSQPDFNNFNNFNNILNYTKTLLIS